NWIAKEKPTTLECFAKFRYRQPDIPVKITFTNQDEIKVETLKPVRASTLGQITVFYLNDTCLTSRTINKVS
ncbi:MAG: aminomethyltransferase beta-barrel domain-containing protein, partial [Spiroplasma sp.]